MNKCPCCNQSMLLYAAKNRLYWYCPSCRQEMPDLVNVMMTARQKFQQCDRRAFHKEEINIPAKPLVSLSV